MILPLGFFNFSRLELINSMQEGCLVFSLLAVRAQIVIRYFPPVGEEILNLFTLGS